LLYRDKESVGVFGIFFVRRFSYYIVPAEVKWKGLQETSSCHCRSSQVLYYTVLQCNHSFKNVFNHH
jgi:hypothetical protein